MRSPQQGNRSVRSTLTSVLETRWFTTSLNRGEAELLSKLDLQIYLEERVLLKFFFRMGNKGSLTITSTAPAAAITPESRSSTVLNYSSLSTLLRRKGGVILLPFLLLQTSNQTELGSRPFCSGLFLPKSCCLLRVLPHRIQSLRSSSC